MEAVHVEVWNPGSRNGAALVQRVPPVDREVHDRHVDGDEQRRHGAAAGPDRGVGRARGEARGSRSRAAAGARSRSAGRPRSTTTPQAGRPHSDPVTSVSAENTAPTSTAEAARRSQKNERVRGHRYEQAAGRGDAAGPVQRDGGDRRVDVEQPGQVPLDDVGRRDPQTRATR